MKVMFILPLSNIYRNSGSICVVTIRLTQVLVGCGIHVARTPAIVKRINIFKIMEK